MSAKPLRPATVSASRVRACEVRLRAERKAGELLAGMEKAKGATQPGVGRAGGTRSDGPTALSGLGISKQQSSDWQRLAAIPQGQFNAALADPDRKPSTAGILREARDDPERVPVR